jgi:hypothetical protein
MNINKTISENVQEHGNYCITIFEDGEKPVVNSYKCNSKKISSADIWNVQKQRKDLSVRNYGL